MALFEHDDALRSMVRRVALAEAGDDAGTQFRSRRARGLRGEELDGVLAVQQHGFASSPPSGSEGLVVALGGRSDRPVLLGLEHREHRPRGLGAGGAALYDAHGKLLKFVEGATDWDAGGKPLTIRNAATVRIEGASDVAIGVAGRWVRIRPGRVDLAVKDPGESAPFRVDTEGGLSAVLWARLD